MLANGNGHFQIVELLLKEHADIDIPTHDGVTALMLASENNHQEVVQLLQSYVKSDYTPQEENTSSKSHESIPSIKPKTPNQSITKLFSKYI